MLPAFTLIPLGLGLIVPALSSMILATVTSNCSGSASAMLGSARIIGGAIGVALFGLLYTDESVESIINVVFKSGVLCFVFFITSLFLIMLARECDLKATKKKSAMGNDTIHATTAD